MLSLRLGAQTNFWSDGPLGAPRDTRTPRSRRCGRQPCLSTTVPLSNNVEPARRRTSKKNAARQAPFVASCEHYLSHSAVTDVTLRRYRAAITSIENLAAATHRPGDDEIHHLTALVHAAPRQDLWVHPQPERLAQAGPSPHEVTASRRRRAPHASLACVQRLDSCRCPSQGVKLHPGAAVPASPHGTTAPLLTVGHHPGTVSETTKTGKIR